MNNLILKTISVMLVLMGAMMFAYSGRWDDESVAVGMLTVIFLRLFFRLVTGEKP